MKFGSQWISPTGLRSQASLTFVKFCHRRNITTSLWEEVTKGLATGNKVLVSISNPIAKATYQHSLGNQKSLAIHSEQNIILRDEGGIVLWDETLSMKQKVAALHKLVKFLEGYLQKRMSQLQEVGETDTAWCYLTLSLRIREKYVWCFAVCFFEAETMSCWFGKNTCHTPKLLGGGAALAHCVHFPGRLVPRCLVPAGLLSRLSIYPARNCVARSEKQNKHSFSLGKSGARVYTCFSLSSLEFANDDILFETFENGEWYQ